MKVFLSGAKTSRAHYHPMQISPGAHWAGKSELPIEWFEDDGRAKVFTIEFRYGEAEIPDHLGKYVVAAGLAKSTRLVISRAELAALEEEEENLGILAVSQG